MVERQFRRQCKVGTTDEREGGIKQNVDQRKVEAQKHLVVDGWDDPHQRERDTVGQRAKEQIWPPSPPAGPRAIREQTHQRVVDRIPDTPDEDGDARQRRVEVSHVGEEEEIPKWDDRSRPHRVR